MKKVYNLGARSMVRWGNLKGIQPAGLVLLKPTGIELKYGTQVMLGLWGSLVSKWKGYETRILGPIPVTPFRYKIDESKYHTLQALVQ